MYMKLNETVSYITFPIYNETTTNQYENKMYFLNVILTTKKKSFDCGKRKT